MRIDPLCLYSEGQQTLTRYSPHPATTGDEASSGMNPLASPAAFRIRFRSSVHKD